MAAPRNSPKISPRPAFPSNAPIIRPNAVNTNAFLPLNLPSPSPLKNF